MEQIDGLAGLAEQLLRKRSGWIWHENPETGALALFPETAKNEAEWERRALAQNAEAEAMERANRLEAKPEENALAARKGTIVRGD